MKIALFTKPSIIKVCFSLLLFVCVIGQTNNAYAGFFSDLITKVFGSEPQTLTLVSPDKEVKHNSQNVPLLESSVNPDLKNMKEEVLPVTIIEDEALISNVGPLGPSLDLGKYASSEKIDTYIVKSGDTLEGIAKKFNISKSTILYSNADLKSSDLLKIGQSLTILPIEGVIYTVKKGDTLASIAKKYNAQASDISEYNILADSVLQVGDSIVIPGGKITEIPEKVAVAKVEKKDVVEKKVIPEVKVEAPVVNVDTTPTVVQTPVTLPTPEVKTEIKLPTDTSDAGQPEGTIAGGYIWPFPAGIGRVSQGLHADQAYDFSAPKGTPIYAIQSGTVLIADASGYNGGYGLYVVVNFDDGGQAIFGHMSKVAAKAGDVVNRGDIIGYVGSTGKSTGNHVHIGYRGGKPSPYKGLKVNSTSLPDHD